MLKLTQLGKQNLRKLLKSVEVGRTLTVVEADLLNHGFTWAKSPQGRQYWRELFEKNRSFTQADYDILFGFLEGTVEAPIEDDIWI